MSDGSVAVAKKEVLDTATEIAIRLALLALLAVWCFQIFRPFILPMISGMIIAVALVRPFGKLIGLVGGKRGLAAAIFTLAAIVLVVLPTFRIADSVVHSSLDLAEQMERDEIRIPPPNEAVRDWPLIGDRIYGAWNLAATNLDAAVARFTPQLRSAGNWALVKMRGILSAILSVIVALIVAGFMLTFAKEGEQGARTLLGRIGGERGEGIVDITAATIRSVALGVLGVALTQAALGGLGMFLVHVPGWGVWTVLILILAVMQLPPILVLAPVIFWVFSAVDNTTVAILFTVWSLIVSASDTFLKPLFLGRGLDIPMPVILIGAIGGLILYGIMGLFVGAVVLAIGYELFQAWMEAGSEARTAAPEGAAESPS
jgi:predicted PurR-regulated permease PerM